MFRRLFVALCALVLSVSILVVSPVVVSPAGAANTASESLVNHDNNPATAQIRAFGGANRYATSVALAQAFRANSGSGGFVDTVIVASGESLVDAAAAAGLAASEVAPVLLTTPDRLPRSVENFIVDEFVSEVFIVGGTASVSQAVEDAIGELAPVRTVTRLAGADRYGTAVAVANEIGSPGVYCDSGQVTALLVNVDSSFADVIAIGPLAYSLELPILLTRANALPADVAGYLTDAEIERVVIVGGTTAVSAAVVADINEAGVEDVVRISGANRYDTALEIRQALSDCGTVTLSPTTFALVNAEAAADGVAAGPLLGLGLANNGVTPVLLVSGDGGDSDDLPADTRNFLRSLPIRNADASFVDVSLTAIGGAAVVPESVVQAAIAAATTSPPITATITATAGSNTVRVTFSAPVNVESDTTDAGFVTSALNRVNYQVSGGPLVPDDTFAVSNNNRTITIGLSGDVPLTENAEASVADGKIKGFGGDNRRVVGTEGAVRALAADRVSPRVEVFAPQGSHAIRIQVTEPSLATDVSTQTDADGAEINAGATTTARNNLLAAVSIRPASGAAVPLYVAPVAPATTSTSIAAVLPSPAQNDITVCLFGLDATNTGCVDTVPADASVLGTSETITIAAGAFEDSRGNRSRSTTQRVTSYSNYPEVRRATVTNPVTLDIGSAVAPDPQVAQWRWLRYGSAAADTGDVVTTNVLTITARPDGAAGGAAGNDWRVVWSGPPATEVRDPDTVAEVSVVVNEPRETVLINFDEDATIFSVVTALAADSAFAELFTVSSAVFTNNELANEKIFDADDESNDNLVRPDEPDATPCTVTPVADAQCNQPNTDTPWALSGGVSVVVVTLSYNETLSSFDYAAGLVAENQGATNFPSEVRIATGSRAQQLVGWQIDPFAADLDLDDEFRFLLTTSSATFADLPKPGDTISLPTALGTTFAPTSCSGLTRIGDDGVNDCGSSIAVTAPGQTLRRGSISGRIEGAQTTVIEAITAEVRAITDESRFTVQFSTAVNVAESTDAANFPTSALNPANYQIDGVDLPGGTQIRTLSGGPDSTSTVRITVSSLSPNRVRTDTVYAVKGDVITPTDAGDDRMVSASQTTGIALPPIYAAITGTVGSNIITVLFTEAVNPATTGSGVRNLGNYLYRGDSFSVTASQTEVGYEQPPERIPLTATFTLYQNALVNKKKVATNARISDFFVLLGSRIRGADYRDLRNVVQARISGVGAELLQDRGCAPPLPTRCR